MRWAENALAFRIALVTSVLRKVMPLAMLLRSAQVAYQPQVMQPPQARSGPKEAEFPKPSVSSHSEATTPRLALPKESEDSTEDRGSIQLDDRISRARPASIESDEGELTERASFELDGKEGVPADPPVVSQGPYDRLTSPTAGAPDWMLLDKHGQSQYHISKFSEELRSLPLQLSMLEMLAVSSSIAVSSIPLATEGQPLQRRISYDPLPSSRPAASLGADGTDAPTATGHEEWKRIEGIAPSRPSIPVEESGPQTEPSKPPTEPSVSTKAPQRASIGMSYLPLLAAQTSIPIASAVASPAHRASSQMVLKPQTQIASKPMESTPLKTADQSSPISPTTEHAPVVITPKVKMDGEPVPHREGALILDEKPSKLTKKDIGIPERKEASASIVDRSDGVPSRVETTRYGEEPSSPLSESNVTMDGYGAPFLFAIAPLIAAEMSAIRGAGLEHEPLRNVDNIVSIPSERTPEPTHGALQATEEELPNRSSISIDEVPPELTQDGQLEIEAKDELKHEVPAMAMLGSAIALTLPPWVESAIRTPSPMPAMEGAAVPISRPKGIRATEAPGGLPKRNITPELPEARPLSEAKAPGIEGLKGQSAGTPGKESPQRTLNERDVVRIVKRWMEEDAKRKGFM